MANPRASKRKAGNNADAASAKTPKTTKQTSKDAIRVTRRSSVKEDAALKTQRGSGIQTEPIISIKEKPQPKSATKKNVVRETRHSSGSTKKGMIKASLNNDSPSVENVSEKTEASSPYDFLEDSVRNDSSKKVNQVKKKTKAANKTDKPNAKSSKAASSKTSKVLPKSKDNPVTSASSKSSYELQKESVRTDMPVKVKRNPLGKVPQLNLDDISPIVRSRRSNPSSMSNNRSKHKENDIIPTRRSPRAQTKPVSASTSFIESVEVSDPNDSALFLSPRKTMPRFSTGKTSTPAELPVKVKSRTAASKKVSATTKSNFKSTSTPYETKPKSEGGFTGIKENISKLSPVPRTETPTSDYASMDSIVMTPEPTPPVKQSRKRRGNSPAFTLDDDDSGENLDLNKSVNKAYKKSQTKRKYEVSKHNTSKLDEWADKVNSELEDLDNFELSIEG